MIFKQTIIADWQTESTMGNKYRWWKLSIKDHTTYSENLEG